MTVVAKGELTVVHQKMHRLRRNACDAESNKNNCSTHSMVVMFTPPEQCHLCPLFLDRLDKVDSTLPGQGHPQRKFPKCMLCSQASAVLKSAGLAQT